MAIEKLYYTPDSSSLQGLTYADVIQQLQTRIKATQERLEEVEAALNRCREYSAQDIETISRQRVKIIELQHLVQKQKITISNQSKAIADPKRSRIRQSTIPMSIFPLTPTQQRPTVRSPRSSTPSSASPCFPSVLTPPPPAFDMSASTLQDKRKSLEESSKTSLSRKRSSFPMSICSPGSSFDTETVIRVISTRLQSLLSRTLTFGHMYTNFPSVQFDSHLNPRVKEYVMSISDKIHASTLLGNPCTRLCVVAKGINFYLVHNILQPTVVKGFDAHMDKEIKQLQEHLTIDTPAVVRHSLLLTIAHHIQAVVKKPRFSEFNQHNIHSYMEKLWPLIGPLTHDPLNQYQVVWMDLQDIVTEAQALAVDLYSLPFEYSFKFPAVNDIFEPSTMVNCDQFMGGDAQRLKKDHTLVRLGVTPSIRIHDHSTSPADVRLVGLAKVLLRPPPRRYTQLLSEMHANPSQRFYILPTLRRELTFSPYLQFVNASTLMNLTPAKRVTVQVRTLADRRISLILPKRFYTSNPANAVTNDNRATKKPEFHDYFVTHLPSSSLHPDPRAPVNPFYKLPRSASVPHTGESSHPPAFQPLVARETTVVRIPLRSAKHHFGASTSRGTRPENEDTYQAGVIDIPAFAKRPPASLTIKRSGANGSPAPRESQGAETASGDPQVFYFSVFDGHGGNECSTFLQHTLHEYIQDSAAMFELQSSLKKNRDGHYSKDTDPSTGDLPILQDGNSHRIGELEKQLVRDWRTIVGGYFKRFVPPHFSHIGRGARGEPKALSDLPEGVTIEEVLEYAFLCADLEFVSAQAAKQSDELENVGHPLYQDNILYGRDRTPSLNIGGVRRFKGGSTASVALISTPTPTPFWHPSSPSSLLVSHVGDTRILLCSTETGEAIPLTSNHHPSSPIEASRLRRYATTFVTDSFGEERMSGLANTRAFGDVQSKRIGVSAEPELRRIEMAPAEYSFLVLMSDGISGTLGDQEVVDIVKEARTPEQGSRDVVNFANEVTKEGDNATCLVVRLGGWERRLEGGLGSMGTKESREWRRQEATDPRRSRR
ncbi:protein phosphatase 2C [Aspergillus nomiae NRRL 13137]|uniref:Protein phosphatase 2C n=1 Tax=Aspergillus nomiae NRRL (strain ATCC 15546 / NRRL 13137 / CBS 260.88 / M93) TaxID=1509407 RepID=A0A0L1IZ49_ASPN3|nr:protein phosphatase 2C [Aspergillus nomiae NRRL 13137]KNG84782.1 protein phosphatase 2C [Aspergillus nomiae NRRL 13137]